MMKKYGPYTCLRHLVRVMGLIERNPGRLTERSVYRIDRRLYPLFERSCQGGMESYVIREPTGFILTHEGARKLAEMRQQLMTLSLMRRQARVNRLIALTALIISSGVTGFFALNLFARDSPARNAIALLLFAALVSLTTLAAIEASRL